MINELEISFIANAKIDRRAYDECIAGAKNAMIYAWSFYLDRMAEGWDLLAARFTSNASSMHSYDFVMPLISKRKWGVTYLYQPTFVQQLGIFSVHTVTDEIATQMIDSAKAKFAFAEIHLNYDNPVRWLAKRSNYVLDLSPGYDKLSAVYTKDLKNNLKLSKRTEMHYTDDVSLDLCLSNFQEEYAKRLATVTESEYRNFGELCRNAGTNFGLVIRGVKDSEGRLIASALMPRKQGRLYLVQSWVSQAGRASKANHFLVDNIVREFAGQNLLLDFEGSDVPGIASFYSNFGAIDQPYYFLQWNELPFMVRKIKSIKDGFRR